MAKRHTSVMLYVIIVGGIILSISCNLPSLSSIKSSNPKGSQSVLTLNDAVELVINEVVQPKTLDHSLIVFALPEPLGSGDTIGAYQKSGMSPLQDPSEITEETWFVWIDDAPGAFYSHSSRFVFVSKVDGQITVNEEEWWPVLNGRGLWTTAEQYWDESGWFYDKDVMRPNLSSFGSTNLLFSIKKLNKLQQKKSGTAIVINGWRDGESNEKEFAIDGKGMHDALEGSDFEVMYMGPSANDDSSQDKEITTENRETWFRDKAKESQPGDTVVVFFNGHGGITDSGIGGIGEVMEDNLKKALDRFDPGVHIIVIIDGCKSGRFIDSMKSVADITITSTDDILNSYADLDGWVDSSEVDGEDEPNPEDEGGEWTSGFIIGWNKIMGDKAMQAALRQRAKKYGTSFWEEVAASAAGIAAGLDASYRAGLSRPIIERGDPSTQAAITSTPSNTATPEPSSTPTPDSLKKACAVFQEVAILDTIMRHMRDCNPTLNFYYKLDTSVPGLAAASPTDLEYEVLVNGKPGACFLEEGFDDRLYCRVEISAEEAYTLGHFKLFAHPCQEPISDLKLTIPELEGCGEPHPDPEEPCEDS